MSADSQGDVGLCRTLCNPPATFQFSFDFAADQCAAELEGCMADSACFGEALAAYSLPDGNPYVFDAGPTDQLQALVLCLSQFEPPPPPPPPPPSATGGGTTGIVSIKVGGLFPLSGTQCALGWHALFGAQKAVDTLNCVGALPPLIVHDELEKFGMDVRGNSECRQYSLEVGFEFKDTQGRKPKALFDTDRLLHHGVDAIVGPAVSGVAEIAALLAKTEQ